MTTYLIKRLFLLIPTLLGVTFLTFLLLQGAPGDPALSLVGERASPEAIEKIQKSIGQDRSFTGQYAGYLQLLLKGELGRSYYTHREVSADLIEKFPNTLRLALAAMAFALVTAILLGTFLALRHGSWIDRMVSLLLMSGTAIPVFWLGLMLILLLALTFHLFPPSGMGNGSLWHLILPAATLGIPSACAIARVTRASVLEVLGQPFVAAARARGLREYRVVFKHTLKNAMIPVLTLVGLDFASYLNGAVLTETLFGWDGIGRFALEGILKRDYPVVMGVVLFGALVFVAINFIVDLLYTAVDPRVRYGEES